MHAVKVGWVGQTFALAKANESGGKKSRIRRSKEDRKAMVESFIKRYQNSNSGNFPSLNLTHKEVGGSFYTVREIVREIIQENRVLGPAKLAEDEQELDQFHEQYPLGSISIECQSHLSSSSEIHVVSSDHQSIRKELESTQNVEVDSQQWQKLDSGRYINGASVNKEYKEVNASEPPVQVNQEILYTELRINQNVGSLENIIDISTSKVTPLATDVVVETFPVKFASTDMESVEETLAVDFEQQEAKRVEAKPVISESDSSGSLDEKSVEHLGDQLVEALCSSTESSTISTLVGDNLQTDTAFKDDSSLKTTNEDVENAGSELKPAPNTVHNKNSNNMGSNQGKSLPQETATIKTKSDNESSYSKDGRNSTLNRTKLESWEGSTRVTAEADTNPVLAVFKAFISAFVKFWTE
ncbi:Dna binding protein [Thalictrum thalictroides]|uniref:Dna binding protein n=1 Tax=Thalictrum thalictroides TaxID=46969 RepID=A0A7J6WVZ9_THATH|nr:Dna binding protein [Thalictrum thalictroides]